MTVLTLSHIAKSFGTDVVLKDVSLSINQGERIGLVGVNGCGKTTLLRILSGELQQDEGQISLLRGQKVGYLSQIFTPKPGGTVLSEAYEAVSHLSNLEERIRALEKQMGEQSGEALERVMAEYARLTERFEREDGYAADSQVTGVLLGLGFTKLQHDQPANTLSGGELTRLGLAKLLLQQPDLLLLDEPTNHLDMGALQWLEGYIKTYPGTVMVVSHDRYFLDAVCDGIVELLFGTAECYSGNYTQYMKKRDERFAARNKAWALQQKEIARQKAIIARFRSFNREKSIKAAESREKALERMELLDRPEEEKQVLFRFKAKRRLGDLAVRGRKLSKAFGERSLFHDLDITIKGDDRVALLGGNGVGKTTLLKCLLHPETLDEGDVVFGPQARIGYYDQRQQDMNLENDILNEVWDAFPRLNQSQVRGALGLFLFSGDDVFTPVSLLSGGERSRVALTKLMLGQDNFLVLDEPTNHLDADSREALETALEEFEGAILAVSHDRYFINRFANRVLVMQEDGLLSFEGNYDDYLRAITPITEGQEGSDDGRTKTEVIKERRQIRQQENKIKELRAQAKQWEESALMLEERLNEAIHQQADPTVYTDPEKAASQARLVNELKEQMDQAFSRWEEAEATLTKAESDLEEQE